MKLKRALWVAAGGFFFVLAGIGAALPVMPTVPFLLLSAACFSRGSERMDAWFKSTKLYQNHLESYMQGRGMTWKTKLRIMAIATAMMLISGLVLLRGVVIVQVLLAVLWFVMVSVFTFVIKTAQSENEGKSASVYTGLVSESTVEELKEH